MRHLIIGTITSAVFLAGGVTSDAIAETTDPEPCAPYAARLDNISARYGALSAEVINLRGELTTTADNLALARAQSEGIARELTTERERVARLRARIERIRSRR